MNLGQNNSAICVYLQIYILASTGAFPEELRGQKGHQNQNLKAHKVKHTDTCKSC